MAFTGFHHHKDLKIQRWGIYKKNLKMDIIEYIFMATPFQKLNIMLQKI